MRSLVLLLILAGPQAGAQKVELTPAEIQIRVLRPPQKPLPGQYHTYSVAIRANPDDLRAIGILESTLHRAMDLPGFKRQKEGGDVTLELSLDEFKWGRKQDKSESRKVLDKHGNTVTMTAYFAQARFSHPVRLRVLDSEKKVLDERIWLEKERFFNTPEFTSLERLQVYQANQFNLEVASTDQQDMLKTLEEVRDHLAIQYGFTPVVETDQLWVTGAEGKAYNDGFQEAYTTTRQALAGFTAHQTPDSIRQRLQPALDFYEKQAARSTDKSKAAKKLRYASLYNLSRLYFWLEDYEQADRYARELITNGFDKEDGERLLRETAELRRQLEQAGLHSRHVKR